MTAITRPGSARSFAILTDVTRCTGCEACVEACKQANHLEASDVPWRWQDDASALSATRWTTIHHTAEGRSVRDQCRHCLDPACVAACPVGALHPTPEGAVAYDPTICLGCRYCILACPFRAVRFDYGSPDPEVARCTLCRPAILAGERTEPACTAACPNGATVFGERQALIAEAHRRIAADPHRYIDHVWGEHDLGGTSVLYISDVDLAAFGWPEHAPDEPAAHLTRAIMHTVPITFLGMCAGLAGVSWIIRRRQRLARESNRESS
jgi:formate dehydrogenase iron-sulfur subunit